MKKLQLLFAFLAHTQVSVHVNCKMYFYQLMFVKKTISIAAMIKAYTCVAGHDFVCRGPHTLLGISWKLLVLPGLTSVLSRIAPNTFDFF